MRRLLLLLLLGFASVSAGAATSFFSASSGDLAASATFEITSGNLQVVLTNTSGFDVSAGDHILTGLFFDITGNPTLSKISATISVGTLFNCTTVDCAAATRTDIGGMWGYRAGLVGAPGGAHEGIAAAGYGLFGSSNLFHTNDSLDKKGDLVSGGAPIDGPGWGLTSAGDLFTQPDTKEIIIKNSATFVLDSLPGGFTLSDITNVSFQYGSNLDEPNLPTNPIPEPEIYAMLAAGLGLMGFVARRRRPRARSTPMR